MKNKNNTLTRREFLAQSGKAIIVSGLTVGGAVSCAVTATYRGVVRDGRLLVDIKLYPELENPGGGVIFELQDLPKPILLINVDGKKFNALSAMCTHMGCTVSLSKNFILCPCHGSTYNLEGKVLRGPAQKDLKNYKLKKNNGRVEININS
jgi:cytochrome b6-f complex iron-sulfur subunit